jgi:hypothetical protein
LSASSIGLDHQVTARLSSPVIAIADRPANPTLVASQRRRPMLWLQASRCVPVSSSRATSGAPQNAPITGGTAYSNACPMM